MQKSDAIDQLAVALAKVHAEFPPIRFNKTNEHFRKGGKGGGYADLPVILDAIRPLLAKHGISAPQIPSSNGAVVTVETLLVHTSGQWISGATSLTASKVDPHGIGAAITYAKRYGLAAILNVAAEDDDDGNAASDPPPAQRQAAPRAAQPASDTPRDVLKGMVREWAKVNSEDVPAACLDLAKRCNVTLNKTTPDDKVTFLIDAVKNARAQGKTFEAFIKETA